ncbi:histidine phosphatase family protein [Allocoprobacillus halotolerans]|uniref:histidine phosphatase family protein n=1 Tax=Allocoprobacillus halotolerans TaxID=2944914 RepID=UPI003390608C
MKTLYLMRHGETLFNALHKIQGWCDSLLTEKGIKQALKAKQWFESQGITFDHAYSSTSERCCDTLELIISQPYQRCKGLKENNYGLLEGEPDYLAENDPQKCATYYLQFGGESNETLKERMVKTLTEIMDKDDHQSVLAVSHGGACFNFLRAWQDPQEELKKDLEIVVYLFTNMKTIVFI